VLHEADVPPWTPASSFARTPGARPFSVRDLRSVFHTGSLVRDFFGDYEAATRRWRFTSAQSAHEAAAFLATTGPLVTLHDPDAVRHADAIRVRGGFSVVARNEGGANRRGTGFYLFRTEDERFAAERYLYAHTRAGDPLLRETLASLDGLAEDLLAQPASELRARIEANRPSTREATTLLARATAARASRAPSESARRSDRRDVLDRARAFARDFNEMPAVAQGRVIGVLAAKSDYHLAVQVDRGGAGMVFERARIAFALTQQFPRERTPDAWQIIGIDLERGYGRALQLRGEQDLDFGAMRMAGALAARERGLLPILHDEEHTAREDLEGAIVGAGETLAVALDAGAYAVVGLRAQMPGPIGTAIRSGPSYSAARVRTRSR
jgi:hypothetical protein